MHLFRRGTSSLFNSSNVSLASSKTDATTDAVGDNALAIEGFRTISESDKLFSKADAAVDGDDCLHDCATCTIKYPAKFDVDMEDELYGQVKGWATHMLVATGKSDWRLKLSASNMSVPDEYHMHESGKQPTTVLILPSFTIVENVTPQLAPDLIEHFVNNSATTTTPLTGMVPTAPADQNESAEEQTSEPIPHPSNTSISTPSAPTHALMPPSFYYARSAPVMLAVDNLRRCSAYSANVIVYRRRDFEWYKSEDAEAKTGEQEGAAQGIWLARVKPEECENIIRYTVLQGKVLKPAQQLRAGFDRERGLTSW
ncbi:hypothetical protein N7454_009280 [Penicillium verhagenii]|nr:hypothetical protein N7454_009280 [Penicillium verhagenii]